MRSVSLFVLFGVLLNINAGLSRRIILCDSSQCYEYGPPLPKKAATFHNITPPSTLVAPTEKPDPCYNKPGYSINKAVGSCYKVHTVEKTWKEAIAVCKDEEAHLATISDKTENYDAEWAHLRYMTINRTDFKYYLGHWASDEFGWIGQNYMKVNDNGNLDTIWSKYPPNICRSMKTDVLYEGNCENKMPFFCERELQEF